MGLVFAEYLAKTVQAKLILIGRSVFSEKDKWDEWITEHNGEDEISIKIRKIKEIEGYGSEVLLLRADVADYEQMRNVTAQSHARFGQINGVIHTAGLADYAGVIQRRTGEMTEQVLCPKVRGDSDLGQHFER